MKLENSVVLVTGATGGLGQEFVAQALARGAAKVYAAARRDHDWSDSRVVPLRLDVVDPAAIEAAAAAARDVTVLVNNAGISGPRSLLAEDMAAIRQTYETNVFGPLALVRAFAPLLAANGGGAVVDIHSVMSWLSWPGAYSSSKAAFWGVTNSLRLELDGQGTQVLGAHFAYVDTPMIAELKGVDKSAPGDIVRRVLDALEAGASEVFADEATESVRAGLAGLTTGRLG
ncbi:SDR family oxidoreductase [Catenulispora sp. NF23]|uniref:SDR family oxidoreductase n=1 Tax=Catenulispora pinistramenti TaxID=2705254 RepID=A0ABS5KPY3_9ACTN|nr:SDR family oxidoreductase [Catenulispora pinistramenti]MBS2535287.1 SDR family oxidoreductase [Catenulispora pinistramenti]MBS2548090.1 SDR family oxidoreductase [Catenulispora pinistramenti]